MSRAFIVVDVQRDFCEGGSLAVNGGNVVAQRIAQYLPEVPASTLLIFTKDFHKPDSTNGGHIALPSAEPDFFDTWPAHCIQGTEGVLLHEALSAYEDVETMFLKGDGVPAYSGFEGKAKGVPLGEYLAKYKVTDVDVVGLASDYCVKATMLDARTYGFNVNLITPLTAGIHQTGEQVLADFREGRI